MLHVLEQAIPKPTADFSRVIVTRNNKDREVNYLKYRNGVSKDREFNPSLEDGDRIFLYEAVPTVGVTSCPLRLRGSSGCTMCPRYVRGVGPLMPKLAGS